jgi:hypothetical protein
MASCLSPVADRNQTRSHRLEVSSLTTEGVERLRFVKIHRVFESRRPDLRIELGGPDTLVPSERRPCGQSPNAFTEHARASNELRVRLFRMAIEDEKRRKSAFVLLGQIEEWRLEYGRPTGEPRHPDLASGQSWPPKEPVLVPCPTGHSHEHLRWVEGGQAVGCSLTGSSGLRPPPPAGVTERWVFQNHFFVNCRSQLGVMA